jgi:ligand-binding sensor domain-containing protein
VEYPWCGIGGVEYDKDGNMWMVNSHTMKCLKVKKTDNTWSEFDFQGMIVTGTTVGELMITELGQKWMIVPRNGGMIVFDDGGTINDISDDRKKKLGFTSTNGAMPGTDVLCMAEDRDGEIWIGTDKGIGVFYCAENIFSSAGCNAQQILIQQGEYTQILMESQVVTSIAIDGANRKWIGTESGGVFLMSADGTNEILHFTTENSPLLSNTVTGVTIDPSTGEVFFATGKGIVSYRSDAVEGEDEMGDVYAYPNPVQPGYSGPIAIKGLVRDADVKITDISGNLVYQTTALGGQAIWNGNNFQGQRAASGVYLVFITNEDGTETRITKILFMH